MSTQLRKIAASCGERALGSPVRETRTPGFTWGEGHKGDRGLSLPTALVQWRVWSQCHFSTPGQ